MTNILSFDAAIHNMGVCLVKYSPHWLNDIIDYTKRLRNMQELFNPVTPATLTTIENLLIDINQTLDSIIQLEWANIYDMFPGDKTKQDSIQRTIRLKALLTHIDTQIPAPNIVLTEYQMVQNNTSLQMSNQLLYHYTNVADLQICNKDVKNVKSAKHAICGAATPGAPISEAPVSRAISSKVVIVKPALKNMIAIAPDGDYCNFVSTKKLYAANKAHTTHNFKYFIDLFKIDTKIKNNKLDDLADAFMQAVVYIFMNLVI